MRQRHRLTCGWEYIKRLLRRSIQLCPSATDEAESKSNALLARGLVYPARLSAQGLE